MHYTQVKGILSSKNGMNLYRGCSHGCIYCDSRSDCYEMKHDFEDIEVKENTLELLEQALKRKRKKCMISTGAMSDPYLPLEKELLYTRRALELIERYGFGIALLTKSTLVLRDLDLLKKIKDKTKAVVEMTLTTYDEKLCRKIEPYVATTRERVEALKVLRDAGIPTVVWLSPILPFINDTEENIKGILNLCHEAGVYALVCFGMGLTLRDGNREYFYEQLDRHFPGLKLKYHRLYGYQYSIESPKNRELMDFVHQFCKEKKILCDQRKIFQYLEQFEVKNAPVQLGFDL